MDATGYWIKILLNVTALVTLGFCFWAGVKGQKAFMVIAFFLVCVFLLFANPERIESLKASKEGIEIVAQKVREVGENAISEIQKKLQEVEGAGNDALKQIKETRDVLPDFAKCNAASYRLDLRQTFAPEQQIKLKLTDDNRSCFQLQNSSELLIEEDGIYEIKASVRFAQPWSDANNFATLNLYKNGNNKPAFQVDAFGGPAVNVSPFLHGSVPIKLRRGDKVWLELMQKSSNTVSLERDDSLNWVALTMVRRGVQ